MLILDTDVIIGIEKQDETVIKEVRKLQEEHSENLVISAATYAEAYHGALAVPKRSEKIIQNIEMYDILPFDTEAARTLSQIKFDLEKKGTPIPLFDLITAAITLQRRLTLASFDAHFKHVPNLKFIHLKKE